MKEAKSRYEIKKEKGKTYKAVDNYHGLIIAKGCSLYGSFDSIYDKLAEYSSIMRGEIIACWIYPDKCRA